MPGAFIIYTNMTVQMVSSLRFLGEVIHSDRRVRYIRVGKTKHRTIVTAYRFKLQHFQCSSAQYPCPESPLSLRLCIATMFLRQRHYDLAGICLIRQMNPPAATSVFFTTATALTLKKYLMLVTGFSSTEHSDNTKLENWVQKTEHGAWIWVQKTKHGA